MNNFNEQFYDLLEQNDFCNNNLIELLILCKSPGIKMDIQTKILYINEIVYQYYETSTEYGKEQINKLLDFTDKQLKFEEISSNQFEDVIFYKLQLDYLEEKEYEDEKEYIFGYNCEYECEGISESFY